MNPILAKLNSRNNQGQGPNIFNLINTIKSGNPQVIFNQMMQSNPQFAQFVNANKGKTPEQIAKEHGIRLDDIYQMLK